jgi:hypothetical protein
MQAITLGSQSFESSKEVKRHIERVLDDAELGELITDDVVLALLRLHPQWIRLSSGMTAVAAAIVDKKKDVAICFGEEDVVSINWRGMLDDCV